MDNSQILTWSTVVLAVATIVLAVITGLYVRETRRMAKEMEEGRKSQHLPVLICEINCDLDRSLREGMPPGGYQVGEFNDILVSNIGNSPAIEVSVELSLDNPQQSRA